MIGDISLAANIYIITGYTDMRKSIDGLYALVMDKLHEEPDRFSIYLFCGRLSKAITYIRNRRSFMMTFLEDGRCSLSNNPSENSIRPIIVGRKNWLLSSSVEGAEASMGIYTIVEIAKLHGLS